jgi:alpha-3'-ketoglucosidase
MKTFNILSIFIALIFITMSCGNMGKNAKSDSKEESKVEQSTQDEGWEVLFDGTSTDNFRGYLSETFPDHGWEIAEDGSLHCIGSGKGEAGGRGGDIITKKKYMNFELSLDWKISEGGNSGIFYLAQEVEGDPIYKSSPEMQVLDNERHPDAKLGVDGNRKAGSLYDLIPAVPQNAKPAGEWNQAKVLVYKGTVVHTQNGVNVVEYHLWTDDWKEMVSKSKFKNWPNFLNVAEEGYIGLQDHGDDVWFRNIKIKEL